MNEDENWIDDTFDKLRSRSAICSYPLSDELEEKMMTEFVRTPLYRRRRLTLAVALAGLIGVGTAGGVAVAAYQDEIREWFFGPLHVEASGDIRNDDGELVGQAISIGDRKLEMQIQGESFVFETAGDGKLPPAPFSISIESTNENEQVVDANDSSHIKFKDSSTAEIE